MTKKIIAHNTMSFLPVRQWWLRPFAWIARCQTAFHLDADGYDLRVRFREGMPVFAHGLIEYEGDVEEWLAYISRYAHGRSVRLLLEVSPLMNRWHRAMQAVHFLRFCEEAQGLFSDLTFYGGWARDEWREKIYDFHTQEPRVTEMHGSVSGNKLNCLWLKAWARRHNREIVEGAQTEWVMLDFVEYK